MLAGFMIFIFGLMFFGLIASVHSVISKVIGKSRQKRIWG
ncbi:MAG: hypothetical protein H6Q43_2636 [Deltaproteobacteria bacterium]|nr:hypothetical protein [Deltaproteobacteria bacterium]